MNEPVFVISIVIDDLMNADDQNEVNNELEHQKWQAHPVEDSELYRPFYFSVYAFFESEHFERHSSEDWPLVFRSTIISSASSVFKVMTFTLRVEVH